MLSSVVSHHPDGKIAFIMRGDGRRQLGNPHFFSSCVGSYFFHANIRNV